MGIEIFRIRNLHSKMYVFDEEFAVISSLNFEKKSIEVNFELGVIVADADELK